MIEVEVFGWGLAPDAPPLGEVRRLCSQAAARMGIHDGHVAIEFVAAERIAQLNGEHRKQPKPTDVLSFPIDGVEPLARAAALGVGRSQAVERAERVPRELGDIVVCPEHTADLREAIVHGMLHLLGMNHETDDGEMLALQRELLLGVSR
jgi:probable rRNA maturation factor